MMKIGDRVRLKRGYAEALMRSPKAHINWLTREGSIQSLGKRGYGTVSIVWDDRRTLDIYSSAAVELIT